MANASPDLWKKRTGFRLPPWMNNKANEERKVGLEIEFSGMPIEETADLIHSLFSGKIQKEGRHNIKVNETELGDFSVESDWNLLKEERHHEKLSEMGLPPEESPVGKTLEKMVEKALNTVAPNEIVCPPIPVTKLGALDKLREAMQKRNALGTKTSVLAAYGLHINPEMPTDDVNVLLSILRSFFLLKDWIISDSEVDITRKVMPYIRPFPTEYVDYILDPHYKPSMNQFIDDYLKFSPTRNRPLDMLPLLTCIDKNRVLSKVEKPDAIKERPTFHYRLPNCNIDDPEWTFAKEWNYWVDIEELASKPDRLFSLIQHYFEMKKNSLLFSTTEWIKEVPSWISSQSADAH